MKRTSLLSTVVTLSIVLSIPAVAFGHGNYSPFSLLDVTDAVTLNH